MKKALASNTCIVLFGALFSVCLIAFLSWGAPRLSDYISYAFPGGQVYAETLLSPVLLFAAIAFFALYCFSVWFGASRLITYRLQKFDYYFVCVFALLALVLIALLFIFLRNVQFAHMIFMPCSFLLLLYLVTTTLVRVREHELVKTIYWIQVFKTLRLNQFSGIFVLGTVSVSTILILYNGVYLLYNALRFPFYVDISLYFKLNTYFTNLCIPAFITVMIAVLCRDILRLAKVTEKEVEEKLKAERFRIELITNVTHDIRTPLTSIINYVDLMQKQQIDNEEMHSYLEIISKKSARLKSLINDLLDASKASAGTIKIERTTIDLSELIGQVVGGFDEALRAANLEYDNPHSDRQVLISADGLHLYRVLENLFANAVKYSAPGSRVYVDIQETESTVLLRIKNVSKDKLNISPEELTQQFVRGDQSRSTEGNGLGLYIAERLTVLMDGQFDIFINGDLFEVLLTFRSV